MLKCERMFCAIGRIAYGRNVQSRLFSQATHLHPAQFRVLGVVGMRFGAAGNVILRRDVVPRGLPILADKVRVG